MSQRIFAISTTCTLVVAILFNLYWMDDFSFSMDELVTFAFARTAPDFSSFLNWTETDMHPPGYYFLIFMQSTIMDETPYKIRAFNHFSSIFLIILGCILFLKKLRFKSSTTTQQLKCYLFLTLMTFAFGFFWGVLPEARSNSLYYTLTYLLCVGLLIKSKALTVTSATAIQWVHPFGVVLTFIVLASELIGFLFNSLSSGLKVRRVFTNFISRYFFVIGSALTVITFMLFFSGATDIRAVSGGGVDFDNMISKVQGGFGNHAYSIYYFSCFVFLALDVLKQISLKKNGLRGFFITSTGPVFFAPIVFLCLVFYLLILCRLNFFEFKYIAPLFIYFSFLLSKQVLAKDQYWISFVKTVSLLGILSAYIYFNYQQHINIWRFANLPKQNISQAILKACDVSSNTIPIVTSYFLPDSEKIQPLRSLFVPYKPYGCNFIIHQHHNRKELKCSIYSQSETILFLHYSPASVDHFIKRCGGGYLFSDYAYVVSKNPN